MVGLWKYRKIFDNLKTKVQKYSLSKVIDKVREVFTKIANLERNAHILPTYLVDKFMNVANFRFLTVILLNLILTG